MYNQNNIFAKIIRGEIPADKVYEDENILAFNDIAPVAPTHVIVIPKGEYQDFADFINKSESEEIQNFFQKVADIADKLGVAGEYRLVTNIGSRAGQSVFHFHMHIIGGVKLEGLIG